FGVKAQVTTSGLSGKVTIESQKGETIIGANVAIVHEPTGTRYQAVTNMDGRFNMQGMRPGGPYKVTVSYIGFQPKTIGGITLVLGETLNLNVWLSESASEMSEVTITEKASKFSAERTGASTNIDNEMIRNTPTIGRTFSDITRLSPYGGNGMSFAGSNGKMSNFTVDGANFNNNFGLTEKLPGGGTPISLEAIEELQVVISPFDVRQTDFIGGGVNAITKSGTNTFKGSAYIYHTNENMQGDAIEREQLAGARDKSQTTTYGVTLGGPILRDKLFFFVNGEMIKSPTVVNRWRGSDNGAYDADNYLSRTSVQDLQAVSDYVSNKYGYDTGSYTDYSGDNDTYKFLARLDWNITDRHHLSARYNYTKSRSWMNPSTSVDGGTLPYGRNSLYSIAFANSMYAMDNYVQTVALDLNSRLADNLTNQLLVTYSDMEDLRDSNSKPFPFIDILDGDGNNYMSLGYELFSWKNAVRNKVFNVKNDVTYYLGSHKIMSGLNYEYQTADNQYMRNGTGYYRFETMDDFLNSRTPSVVCLTYGYDGDDSPTSRVTYNKMGFYAQDDWHVTDFFKLTYGLRLDALFFNDNDLMTNNGILALDYNGRHVDTGEWPSGSVTASPRVGFTWDVLGDNSLKVRGGSGLFMGRLPLVFFTNMPSNSNMMQMVGKWNTTGSNGTKLTAEEMAQHFGTGMKLDANGYPSASALKDYIVNNGLAPNTITPEDGTVSGAINGIASDFKLPQTWKTSLAVDYQLPVSFPFILTAEAMFNKTVNGVYMSDWSLREVGGYARLNGADSRALYQDYKYTYTNAAGKVVDMPSAYVLQNTGKGYGYTLNLLAEAKPADWVSLMASYTHTAQKELTGMPGSNASSAFSYIPSVDGPNFLKLHNSQFVTPDRFLAAATFHDKSNNHYSFIYETWRGGYNYSYMTTNDMNGDANAYDLIYIPTDAEVQNGQFRFASADDQTRFMDFVHNDSYLSSHQGEYAEAYSVYSPWVHRIDFAYKHDFKFNVGTTKHTLQLSFDMKNVLNLFNSSWGVSKYMNPDLNSGRILKYEGNDAQGYAIFSTPKVVSGDVDTWKPNHAIGQCWYAAIGVKYIFN
ncbi:MAG: carboxypeptidase regulatory-like domain-containing protein, partial [Bacteroidaceae bacterium]|nr:carboxypeptidase regulatory-like domain-containing protein [Bacteroidaceae bacterium]